MNFNKHLARVSVLDMVNRVNACLYYVSSCIESGRPLAHRDIRFPTEIPDLGIHHILPECEDNCVNKTTRSLIRHWIQT